MKRHVVVFGSYDDSDLFVRNRVLVELLRDYSDEFQEIRPVNRDLNRGNFGQLTSLGRAFSYLLMQFRCFISLARQRKKLADASFVFIPYPSYLDRFYFALLTFGMSKKILMVDAFFCLYDTMVLDRRLLRAGSFSSKIVFFLEKITLSRADKILIDTDLHRERLYELYGLPSGKIHSVPVGLDETQWQPMEQAELGENFEVLFWGTFIPLHGIQTIVEAAVLLMESEPSVKIRLIGDGQTADEIQTLLEGYRPDNLVWSRCIVDTATLRESIAAANCVLGIFGESNKAASVVPYKVHQALACNRRLITRQSDSIGLEGREVPGLYLIPPGSPKALEGAILKARESALQGEPVTTRGLYDRKFSNAVVAEVLGEVLAVDDLA